MARKIYGRIVDQKGSGLSRFRVQAWDDDWPDADDLMGQSMTNAKGDYAIRYRGGHWDSAPHRVTTWRPDVFIAVQAKTRTGDWAHVAKSRVYKNQKLAQDRKINLRVRIAPVEKRMTAFNPRKHGFAFRNSFPVIHPRELGIEPHSLKGVNPRKLGIDPEVWKMLNTRESDIGDDPWKMGFCGGMTAAALYRFNTGQPVPPRKTTPPRGSALYNELLFRQMRSIPPSVIAQIYDWQSAPDEGHATRKHSVGYRTKREWPALRAQLAASRPTQLVLIREEGYAKNLSNNHQVLAIGYEWNPTTKDLIVYVYDPNERGRTDKLTMNLGLPRSRLKATDSTGERLRGFFVNPAGAAASRFHPDFIKRWMQRRLTG